MHYIDIDLEAVLHRDEEKIGARVGIEGCHRQCSLWLRVPPFFSSLQYQPLLWDSGPCQKKSPPDFYPLLFMAHPLLFMTLAKIDFFI